MIANLFYMLIILSPGILFLVLRRKHVHKCCFINAIGTVLITLVFSLIVNVGAVILIAQMMTNAMNP